MTLPTYNHKYPHHVQLGGFESLPATTTTAPNCEAGRVRHRSLSDSAAEQQLLKEFFEQIESLPFIDEEDDGGSRHNGSGEASAAAAGGGGGVQGAVTAQFQPFISDSMAQSIRDTQQQNQHGNSREGKEKISKSDINLKKRKRMSLLACISSKKEHDDQ